MHRLTTALAVVGIAVGVTVPLATTAMAATPTNDTVAGATAVTTLPFDDTVDTSQATTDSNDSQLNAQCGAPVTNGSVWYTYTPAQDGGVVFDVSGSDYSSGVIVAEGGPGNWFVDTCGPGSVGLPVYAGTTYYVLAFSDTPGVTGGHLVFHADQAPPPPTVQLTVNKTGKVDRYGNAVVTGTLTCTNADGTFIEADLNQPVGRFAVSGSGYTGDVACNGTPQQWSAVATPNNGKFAGGKAATFTFAVGCGQIFCSDTFITQTVKLSK
jgi:hypothetical protein